MVLKLNGDTVETETQVYNAANELTSQVVKGVTVSYAYDQFGRLTQKSKTGSRVANFYYNYGDKLTKVSSNFQGEGTVTYTYSGDQKRRSRSVSGGATTKYRFDHGWNVLNEEDGTGALQLTYIERLATSAGSTASSGTWSYYSKDVIGSTRGLWDEDGERLGKYDYTPFGGNYSSAGQGITRKYTGHDWDSTARLYHTAYRNYSPDMGRWISRDPLGMVDGPNVYAYVTNSPIGSSDPLGMFTMADLGSSMRSIGSLLSRALDMWDFVSTLTDPCASGSDKTMAVVGAISGKFLTGERSVGSRLRMAALGDAALDVQQNMNRARKANWKKPDGSIWWPDNDGFDGVPTSVTILPGAKLDRFGGKQGYFVSPFGTKFEERSLAPGTDPESLKEYVVLKPLEALHGRAAPWFDQPWGGTQFQLGRTIADLLEDKVIAEVK